MLACNMCSIDCNCVFNNPYKNNVCMKANAPEKLYLHPTAKGNVGASWLTFPLTDKDIEYTRTDAFIEKAWNWVEDNILSSNQQDKSHLYYEQFRNYMEGE